MNRFNKYLYYNIGRSPCANLDEQIHQDIEVKEMKYGSSKLKANSFIMHSEREASKYRFLLTFNTAR